MKRLLLLFLIIILGGCSEISSGSNKSDEYTISDKKYLTELLEIIHDDTFKNMTSEVNIFTQDFFESAYINKEEDAAANYNDAIINLKSSIEEAKTGIDNIENSIDISEYRQEDEGSKSIQLQKDLIDTAEDYLLLFEDWTNAEEMEQKQILLNKAYEALENYESIGEEYVKIFEDSGYKETPQIAVDIDLEDNTVNTDSSYSNDKNETELNTQSRDNSSFNPADFNRKGEYKPVEDMTQEEIEEELLEILGESLGQ